VPGDFAAHAATVTVAWDPSPDDVIGYKIHYGNKSKDYQHSVDVGNFTSCDISGLAEGTTIYFAASAYNTTKESILSQEIAYTIPVLEVAEVDTDSDGILDNDEISIYGTDPNKSDTDADGINDGEELEFWGNNWKADGDQDGLINILDPDSDDDGDSDSYEISRGEDPSDPSPKEPSPEPEAVNIWLEAEEGELFHPMEEALDDNASSGSYIWVPSGNGNLYSPSPEAGYAEYTFNVPTAGTYIIWGRVISNNLADDSFFVSIDGGEYIEWHTQLGGVETWIWDQVRNGPVDDDQLLFLELEAGEHSLIIKQREDGTKIDRLLITNNLDYVPEGLGKQNESLSVKLWLEAEEGQLNIPMEIARDDEASLGEYIWVPNGKGNNRDPANNAGYAEYVFEVTQAGNYIIWGRIIAKSRKDNSFFISVDDGDYTKWHTITSKEWIWDQVGDQKGADPVIYYLDAGEHSLIIKQREDGTKIDKILITNDENYNL
jgi:hypothetical protein